MQTQDGATSSKTQFHQSIVAPTHPLTPTLTSSPGARLKWQSAFSAADASSFLAVVVPPPMPSTSRSNLFIPSSSANAPPAIALTNDIASVLGLAQQLGVAEIFARQIQLLGSPGRDISLGLTLDGNDESVLRGLSAAQAIGNLTIGTCGMGGGKMTTDTQLDFVSTSHRTTRTSSNKSRKLLTTSFVGNRPHLFRDKGLL